MKKTLSILITLALLVSGVSIGHAENAKRIYGILSFEKGLNSHASSYVLGPGQAQTAQNVRFNQSFGALAKRNPMLSYGTAGSASINGMHRYYKADGTTRLIVASSTKLFVGTDSSGAFTQIAASLTDGKRWQFQTYKDVAIGVNGFDKAIKYDGKVVTTANTVGARSAGALTAQLGAPFAELATGSNLDSEAWYQYKIAFYNG
jgi:hypothetical protein